MSDEDTIKADEADETVVADAGDDTLAADAGDTVVADAAEPFAEFDEPAAKPKEKAAAFVAKEDELDKELQAAETELEADPSNPEIVKKFNAVNRKLRKRDADEKVALKSQIAAAAEEAGLTRFIEDCGLSSAPPEVRQKITREAVRTRFDKHFKQALETCGSADEARGEARATLRSEIKTIIKAAGKTAKPLTRVRSTDTGARLTPPGGGGGRTEKEPVKPDRVFIDGDWSYPIPQDLDGPVN